MDGSCRIWFWTTIFTSESYKLNVNFLLVTRILQGWEAFSLLASTSLKLDEFPSLNKSHACTPRWQQPWGSQRNFLPGTDLLLFNYGNYTWGYFFLKIRWTVATFLLFLLRLRPPLCRFAPTCSFILPRAAVLHSSTPEPLPHSPCSPADSPSILSYHYNFTDTFLSNLTSAILSSFKIPIPLVTRCVFT